MSADYEHFRTLNKSTGNSDTYKIANAALDYQHEKSSWGFRLTANNLLDTGVKVRNSISDIIVSEQIDFILPRVWLLSVRYKL